MELVFATHNQNKLKEVRPLMPHSVKLLSLSDINCNDEIQETGLTIPENALIKARYVYQHYKMNCFADDSGLEVKSLNGAPGVFSARFAGEQKNTDDNNRKLLKELENVSDRSARFVTVMALILDGKEYLFEGEIKGTIAFGPHGENGFGYDPLFIPEGSERTFADMEPSEKNAVSHRARAVQKLISFLKDRV